MHDTLPLAASATPVGAAAPQTLDLVRYLGFSALVIAGVVALALFLPRLAKGAWRTRAARRSLKVVDLLPLGGRKKLTVVQVYDRTFVLGLGDKEICLVAELEGAEIPAPEPQTAVSDGDSAERAAKFLARLAESVRKDPVPAARATRRPQPAAAAPPEHSDLLVPVAPPTAQAGTNNVAARAGQFPAPGRGRTVEELLRGEGVLG